MMTEDQVGRLLEELCVRLGLCLPPDRSEQIHDHPPGTPEAFARVVFAAEGLDYDLDAHPGLKDAVRETIARHMSRTS